MIDIHIHILPGLDDGAKDWNESLNMARVSAADGVTDMIVTPHFNHSFHNSRTIVIKKVHELQARLQEHDIPLRVYAGNEVRLESIDYVLDHDHLESFCLLGPTGRYILLEQRWKEYDPRTPEMVGWFQERGVQVILPHPERHDFFRNQPELLTRLIEIGVWTQVTADSLAGRNHPEAKRFAEWLVQKGYAHTLATDAHNDNRKPNLSEGYAAVERLAGSAAAQAIRDRMADMVPQA